MFNWDTRYSNLLKIWGRDLENGSVLEVGSGPQGVARYLQNNVTGLELHRIRPAVKNLQIIEGSVTAIPYPDNAFDYVICSDVLEHLPAASRLTAIAEIIRVAKIKCFIQGPHGNIAFNAEKMLADSLGRYGMAPPQWLKEHLENGLPKVSETIMGVFDAGFIPSIRKNEGIVEHYASIMLDLFFPQLWAFQTSAKANKESFSEIRYAESDEPYSLLVLVDKQRPLKNVTDPFLSDIRPISKGIKHTEKHDGGDVTIFSVHHKSSEVSSQFKLIRAFDVTGQLPDIDMGLKEPEGFFEENNDRCSEMSAIHFIWKRRLFGDTVGFCHYRRYLYLFPEDIKESEIKVGLAEIATFLPRIEDRGQIHALLDQYDLLTSRPMETNKLRLDEQYAVVHFANDYYTMVECIIEKYPFLGLALDESMNSTVLYGTNMLICKKDFFDVFCRVWFDILDCCAKKLDPAGRNTYQTRDIGFLSERVFDILVRHLKRNGYGVCELPRVFVEAMKKPVPGISISRNQPCPCGSGKRYKHCCGDMA